MTCPEIVHGAIINGYFGIAFGFIVGFIVGAICVIESEYRKKAQAAKDKAA